MRSGHVALAKAFLERPITETSAWDVCTCLAARALFAEHRDGHDEAAPVHREAAERWYEFGSVIEQAYALIGAGRCGDAKARREGEAIFARLGTSPVLAVAA